MMTVSRAGRTAIVVEGSKRFGRPSSANAGPAPGQYEVQQTGRPRGVLPIGKQSKKRFEVRGCTLVE